MNDEAPVCLFIGSSKEGLEVARILQAELEAMRVCEVDRWDVDVFEPSGYTLDSLLVAAGKVDFAVLIASPDDIVVSRGVTAPSVRDNILLEFGLSVGALGRERTYLLATGDRDLRLPDGRPRSHPSSLQQEVRPQHAGGGQRSGPQDAEAGWRARS